MLRHTLAAPLLALLAACGGSQRGPAERSPCVEVCMENCGNEPPRSELLAPCIMRCEEQCGQTLRLAPAEPYSWFADGGPPTD